MDPKCLTDEKLLSMPTAKRAVARPKSKKAKNNDGKPAKENEEKPVEEEAESSNTRPAEGEPGPSKKPGPKAIIGLVYHGYNLYGIDTILMESFHASLLISKDLSGGEIY